MVDPSKLQQYLESVRERGRVWWKLPARLIKEIDEATWFEFGLNVKSVESKKREEAGKQENQPKPVLTALNEYGNVPVLVIGSPGAGKSTLLAKALFERANRALNDPTAPVPVLIELKSYSESGIWGLIQAALEVYNLYVEVPEIKQLVADKKLLLLADGVNELPEEKARLELTTFCRKQIPMIFTIRDLGGDLGIEQKLEIQALRSDEVEIFLRDRLPRHDQRRVQELCDRVRDFGQTPLMVWMLYSVFQGTSEIPTTRGEAYRAFTTLYTERAKEGIPLDESCSLMEKLAFEMMHSEKPTDISEKDAQKLVGGEKILNHLLKYHLLERQGHPGNRRVRFCHQSLQEYYAAEALLQKLPDLSDYTLKRDYLNYLKWTEAIALMSSLPDNEVQAVQVIQLALEVDWMLGARLAAEIKRKDCQSEAVRLIRNLDIPLFFKSELLGKTGSDYAVPDLCEALIDGNIYVREEAIGALGKINSKHAACALEKVIKNENDNYLRSKAIEQIGNISNEFIIGILAQALHDRDSYCRATAAFTLGETRNEAAISPLIQALKHESKGVRSAAASALGKFCKDGLVLEALMNAVDDEDSFTRRNVAVSLGENGSKLAVETLHKLMNDSDFDVRRHVALALGHIKSDFAISTLHQMLASETNEIVLQTVIYASGEKMQDDSNQTKEIKSLDSHKENTHQRDQNVEDSAISSLYKMLNHEDFFMRESAILGLGVVGNELSVAAIKPFLNDEDPDIRRSAASSLGRIGGESAVIALIEALSHRDRKVLLIASKVLSKIAGSESLASLWDLKLRTVSREVDSVISNIQKRCGLYNYEIAQSAVEEGSRVSGVGGGERAQVINNTYNVGIVGNLNTGSVTIHGDQVGEQHQSSTIEGIQDG